MINDGHSWMKHEHIWNEWQDREEKQIDLFGSVTVLYTPCRQCKICTRKEKMVHGEWTYISGGYR